jgi:hypothetical protein
MRAKERNRRSRFRENGILAVYLLRFFWHFGDSYRPRLMVYGFLVMGASSGSLPGLAGTVLPFSRRAGGMEQGLDNDSYSCSVQKQRQ